MVAAPDNTTTKTYTISINTVSEGVNADLAYLEISTGTLSPGFDKDTTAYNVDVASSETQVYVSAVAAGINAYVQVNNTDLDEDDESQAIPLTTGITNITVTVTSENGTTKNYVIAVNRFDSNSNANLANLTLSAGALSGGFSPDTTSYTSYVLYAVSAITVTPTAAWKNAVIKVKYGANEEIVASSQASHSIPLLVGSNTITIEVTAGNNSIKNYIVTVSRTQPDDNAELANLTISGSTINFEPDVFTYAINVPWVTTSITITPTTAVSTSVAVVNDNAEPTPSGTASKPIELDVGTNEITVNVIAETGRIETYLVIVNRTAANTNTNLSSLSVSTGTLSPGFYSGTTSYTVTLPYTTTGIRVTPTVAGYRATVSVNGTLIASGTSSALINLSVGNNIIAIEVTAESGSKKTYIITVGRVAANSDTRLSSITVSAGTLDPVFNMEVTSYRVTVPNSTTSISVTPRVSGLNATVRVNGTLVQSGSATGNINLLNGDNSISIVVTAENGSSGIYTVVARRQDNNAKISSIAFSNGTIVGMSNIWSQFEVDVNEDVDLLRIVPTAESTLATISVNGLIVQSGTSSGDLLLPDQTNTVTIVVTAEDGTIRTYSVVINRINLLGISVSIGYDHTMILKNDGTLWGAGFSSFGQFGNGNYVSNNLTQVQVMTDVKQVSAGYYHTMILKNDGTLWAAGYNNYGQLGDGTTLSRGRAVQIMSDVSNVFTGHNHTMILMNDGTLWASGYNSQGQLGDGTTTNRSTPVQVMTDVTLVSAYYYHTMVVKNDGTLWAMGRNDYGQLGDGTLTNRSTPVQVMTGVKSVSAGYYHTMILKNDGTLWAVGWNAYGEFGDGSTINKITPVQVMTDVKDVSAKIFYTVILKNDGTLWATGNGCYGQFGNGTTAVISVPVQIMTDVLQVEASVSFTIIQKGDGTFWGAGENDYGQFGNGTTTNSRTFIQLPW